MSLGYFRPWMNGQEAHNGDVTQEKNKNSEIKVENNQELELDPYTRCSSAQYSLSTDNDTSRPSTSDSNCSRPDSLNRTNNFHLSECEKSPVFPPRSSEAGPMFNFLPEFQQQRCWNFFNNPYVGFPSWVGNIEEQNIQDAVHRVHMQDVAAKRERKIRPKRFPCPIKSCKKAFSNNGQLTAHIRIHTGERPFQCEQKGCDKSFTRNEELTRHKRIHTGERPYNCDACKKKFGRKDHLKKHSKTHERQPESHILPLPSDVYSLYNCAYYHGF